MSNEVQALPASALPEDDSDDLTGATGAVAFGSDLDEDEEVVDPRAVKTKHGIIGSPFTKLAVVGSGHTGRDPGAGCVSLQCYGR
jgi:hypothetical protein